MPRESRQEGALKVASEWKLHGEHELDQSGKGPQEAE